MEVGGVSDRDSADQRPEAGSERVGGLGSEAGGTPMSARTGVATLAECFIC